MTFPDNLNQKLNLRSQNNSLRSLKLFDENYIDFFSNDYLGFGRNPEVDLENDHFQSKGSRLISGNNELFESLEERLADLFQAEAALFFNSGYDANLGFFASIPQKGDTVLYDQYIHASVRDGLQMSFANKYGFKHNNVEDLEKKILKAKGQKYVVVESVYSMDGDVAPLLEILKICKKHKAYLIVDEAHATGLFGDKGLGKCEELGIEKDCFARIHTFGKALGANGAVVFGSHLLKQYLVNFCRTFIYTTAMDNYQLLLIEASFDQLFDEVAARKNLFKNIDYFKNKFSHFSLETLMNDSPIQSIIIPGNDQALDFESHLVVNRINVKAILSPTVPEGAERLRISLHSFNTFEEIDLLYYQASRYIDSTDF